MRCARSAESFTDVITAAHPGRGLRSWPWERCSSWRTRPPAHRPPPNRVKEDVRGGGIGRPGNGRELEHRG